ncbi:hypothetical protein SAMN05444159_5846 [Bradyrhizobium lablabi]|uniref:Uncharacterized protein n=1 Tax=Bradyrhizobium lablabi TaxID=722472 RepID=A0A1M7AFM7_9BRAD|nr:hypothetical protein SAMN05444159_5846 [Bradyrhizobium lablabi]
MIEGPIIQVRTGGSAFTISIRRYGNVGRPSLFRERCFESLGPANDWAPVHQSIAGPVIFALCEGFLVHTSFVSKPGKRVAFALRVSRI